MKSVSHNSVSCVDYTRLENKYVDLPGDSDKTPISGNNGLGSRKNWVGPTPTSPAGNGFGIGAGTDRADQGHYTGSKSATIVPGYNLGDTDSDTVDIGVNPGGGRRDRGYSLRDDGRIRGNAPAGARSGPLSDPSPNSFSKLTLPLNNPNSMSISSNETDIETESGDVGQLILGLTSDNGPWYIPGGLGAYFFVSDLDGYTEYISGTLCSTRSQGPVSAHLSCLSKLPAGRYLLRVTNPLTNMGARITWSFCGTSGDSGSQIVFSISRSGHCSIIEGLLPPNGFDFNNTYLLSTPTTTLMGAIELGGSFESKEFLQENDHKLIQTALTTTLVKSYVGSGFSNNLVVITDSHLVPISYIGPTNGHSNRKLEGDIKFSVGFHVQVKPNVRKLAAAQLEHELRSYLTREIRYGSFVSTLQALAKEEESQTVHSTTTVSRVTSASLTSLQIIHDMEENVTESTISTLVIGLCGVVGMIMGVLVGLYFYHKFVRHPSSYELAMDTSCATVAEDLEL